MNQGGPHPTIAEPLVYDVVKPVSPTFVQLTGGVVRAAIRFDTGNGSIGSKAIEFTFYWRKLSASATGNLTVVIRKASDDSIAATLAQWPIPLEQPVNELNTAKVRGANNYNIVANDLISIEATTGLIEVATNPSQANPVGTFTSRSYNGTTWSSTANAIAGTIKTRVST